MFAKIKKYIYPFIFVILALLSFLTLSFFLEEQNADMGGFAILLFALILIIGVFLPIYCFTYGKKVLLNEKRKLLFTLYNSTIITLCYLLPLCMEGETYIYSLILSGWCELWTALPLIKSKNQTKNINTAE